MLPRPAHPTYNVAGVLGKTGGGEYGSTPLPVSWVLGVRLLGTSAYGAPADTTLLSGWYPLRKERSRNMHTARRLSWASTLLLVFSGQSLAAVAQADLEQK